MRYKGEKAKAWEAVKVFVRKRGKGKCYTCPARYLSGQNAQAGHFKPVALVGSNNTHSWDARFIQLQCGRCNGTGQGMALEYREHLVHDYGEDVVCEFEANYRRVSPIKNFAEVTGRFKKLAEEL